MRNYILLPTFMLLFSNAFSQIQPTQPAQEEPRKFELYFIGIGNEDDSFYQDILTDLSSNSDFEITAHCDAHHVIGVSMINRSFKSYDIFKDYLLSTYPTIELERKDGSILNRECKDELIKQ